MNQQLNELRHSAADLLASFAVVGSAFDGFGNGSAARPGRQGLRAQWDAADSVMSRAWSREWWGDATPEEIATGWFTAARWANAADPYARVTVEAMRRDIRSRYGAEIPPWPAPAPG